MIRIITCFLAKNTLLTLCNFRCYNLKAVTTDTFKTAKVEKVRENEKNTF